MKKLLTLLFAVAIAFSLTTSTFAQDTGEEGRHQEGREEREEG